MSIQNLSNTKLIINDKTITLADKNHIHQNKESDIKKNDEQQKNLQNPEKIYLYNNNIVVMDNPEENAINKLNEPVEIYNMVTTNVLEISESVQNEKENNNIVNFFLNISIIFFR